MKSQAKINNYKKIITIKEQTIKNKDCLKQYYIINSDLKEIVTVINWIVTQDRDKVIAFTHTSYANIVPAYYDGIYYGENLTVDGKLAGTFSTYGRARAELMNLYNRDDDIYGIDGYDEDNFELI